HGRNTDTGPDVPGQLQASTLADWLKAESPNRRGFGVSGKDRAALKLARHKQEGVYRSTGGFGLTTSVEPGQSAEAKLAPVAGFNSAFQQGAETAAPWARAYAQCQGLAGDWSVRGQTFHSTVPPSDAKFDTSPLLDEQTVLAAE